MYARIVHINVAYTTLISETSCCW